MNELQFENVFKKNKTYFENVFSKITYRDDRDLIIKNFEFLLPSIRKLFELKIIKKAESYDRIFVKLSFVIIISILFLFWIILLFNLGIVAGFVIGFVGLLFLIFSLYLSGDNGIAFIEDLNVSKWCRKVVSDYKYTGTKENFILHEKNAIEKYNNKDYYGAIDEFELALSIKPNNQILHFNLAGMYSLIQNKDKAFYHLGCAAEYKYANLKDKAETNLNLEFIRQQPEFKEFIANGFKFK
jgi:tetratricopeptide (TPR) repeat protein